MTWEDLVHSISVFVQIDMDSQYMAPVAKIVFTKLVHRTTHHIVALGGTHAMHEFLILHYFATDSAAGWDIFLQECLPENTWTVK